MKKVVLLARLFPKASGRVTFIKGLMEKTSKEIEYKIITWYNIKQKNVIVIKRWHGQGISSLLHYYYKSYKILRNQHKERRINYIVGTGLSAPSGMLYARLKAIPAIYNLSGIRNSEKPNRNLYAKQSVKLKKNNITPKRVLSGIRSLIKLSFEVLGCWLATTITVPSEYCKNRLIDVVPLLNGEKIQVINEGVNIKTDSRKNYVLKKCGYKSSDKIIVFSRAEEAPYKKIFESLTQDIPAIKIIHIKSRTIEIQKGKKIVKKDLKVKDVLKIADIMFCIPFVEPHSYTVLEALKFNVPCFVSKTGWLEYEYKEFPEFMLDDISPKNILKTINQFYRNRKKFIKKNDNVKEKLLNKYDFNKCINQYKKLFENLSSNI